MEKTKISSSLMGSYDWCERKFRLRHVEKIDSGYTAPQLSIGRISHTTVDKFWDKYKLDLETYQYDLDDYFKETVKRIRIKDINIYSTFQTCFSNFINFQKRRIDTYIKEFGKEYVVILSLFYPILSEKRGYIQITDDITFAFVVDALFENPNGNMLIDWKTDVKCTEADFKKKLPQLNRYSKCLPRIGYSCKKVGIFFLRESLFFNNQVNVKYSLEDEVLGFVRTLQTSKYKKVPKKEKWKCYTKNYECEYYPDICNGTK